MKTEQNKYNEIFKQLSELEISMDTSKDITRNALSMILDAINSSIGGMIITDTKGCIRFANPSFCKMFDYSLSEILGQDATELFSTKEVRTFTDVIAIVDISKDDTEEFIVEKKNGESFVVEVSASNVTDVSGKIVGRMASFVDRTKRRLLEADREKLIGKLQDAHNTIKILRGIIPICSSCKSIRDDKGYWNQLESYIRDHSEAVFSHGICPDCAKKLYPEFYK